MSKAIRTLIVGLVVLALLAGCAPQATPTSAPIQPPPPTQVPPTAVPPTQPPPTAVPEPKVFRAPAWEPDSLDPSKGGAGYQEYQNLYEPLVDAYALDGEIKPLAAESFTVSPDGLTYTFKLRPNLKWSDGQPLVAEDYRFAWLRQLDPATASYSPDYFYAIVNGQEYNEGTITDPNQVAITCPDTHIIVVQLKEPAPYFLRYVGSAEYFPMRKDILEKYGDKWMEAGNFVGNGPYMLQEWLHDQKLVLVKNPYYEGVWKDTRNIDRIEYICVQDPWSQGVAPYEANEVDVAIVPATDLDRIKSDPKLSQELQLLPITGANIIIFDTKNPPTNDVRVRQALVMAIDRETIAGKVLKGAYDAADSFSPPGLNSYDPSSFLGYNPARAKELLAEAGYPDGKGFPAFEFVHWTGEREVLCAQAIIAMWKDTLGITVKQTVLEPKAMRDYRISRATEPYNVYFAINWAGIADPSEFHNAQLDPASNVRHSRYDNAEYVQLIRDAMKETDLDKRDEMYRQAEAFINRDVPIISVVFEARNWLVKPYVRNFEEVTTAIAEMTRVASPPGLDIVK
ncbi:MAG: peptide ABC transporter substrate-binding protein [Chloroflexi bacterium]|nr:peptide ABC transporter substrate-binding protein [Chloroflexota bacterium]